MLIFVMFDILSNLGINFTTRRVKGSDELTDSSMLQRQELIMLAPEDRRNGVDVIREEG